MEVGFDKGPHTGLLAGKAEVVVRVRGGMVWAGFWPAGLGLGWLLAGWLLGGCGAEEAPGRGEPSRSAMPSGGEPGGGTSGENVIWRESAGKWASRALLAALGEEGRRVYDERLETKLLAVTVAEPNNPLAFYHLGATRAVLGKKKLALESLKKSVALCDELPQAQSELGLAYLHDTPPDYRQAQRHGECAIELDPANARYHNNLGAIYEAQGNWRRAFNYYRQAVHLTRAGSPHYLRNAGWALYQLKEPLEAIGFLESALKLDEKYVPALTDLGYINERLKRISVAVGYFTRAVSAAPEAPLAHYHLARIYASREHPTWHRPDRALHHANLAVRYSEGRNPVFLDLLAQAAWQNCRYAQAVRAQQEAFLLDPRPEYEAALKKYRAEWQRLKKNHDAEK